jgi:glycosyltransferase involved in cell wall biosynthesis
MENKLELIYIVQAGYLWSETVVALRSTGARVVHYTSDYFGFREYCYRHLFRAVHLYDAHVITNLLNKPILEGKGATKIIVTEFGYDPTLHRPQCLTSEEKSKYQSEAAFVGHWEPTTEQMIVRLRESGISVKVCGQGWKKARLLKDRTPIRPIPVEEYVKSLAATKIGLCFLSKWNRNRSAGRTFEIPAVGRFLLAERTPDHLSYFEEGKEAEFFSSAKELVEKAKYYLDHEDEREAIARAGHERCVRSGYTHQDRVKQTLEAIR